MHACVHRRLCRGKALQWLFQQHFVVQIYIFPLDGFFVCCIKKLKELCIYLKRPLFHYHPGEINFDEDYWEAYQEANNAFADALEEIVEDGDMIWVHDYHLMLLPAILRQRLESTTKDVKIGFFLHTPFPSSEIYR